MLIPPPFNTQERKEFDLLDLKGLFFRCQTLGISKNIEVRKCVCVLKDCAGKEEFQDKIFDLSIFIEEKRKEIEKKKEIEFNNCLMKYYKEF